MKDFILKVWGKSKRFLINLIFILIVIFSMKLVPNNVVLSYIGILIAVLLVVWNMYLDYVEVKEGL